MTDYIVAIDLGTSHITGIVGEKNADGTFSIIANGTEETSSCVHRGNIYNVENTAKSVSRLVKKLETGLKGGFIDRVYVGVGGQSVRTVDHVEVKEIENGRAVSSDDIQTLKEQCEKYGPDLLDVLGVAPGVYYLDGRKEMDPVGVPCRRLEARYKIVVGRRSIRRDLINSIRNRCHKEIAGIIVSPLALADAMLSKEEKELGCALVDFGAGVTSVTVYKNGEMLYAAVIPLGGNLITYDITSLRLTEVLSEKLKKEHGSAMPEKEDEGKTIKIDMESEEREISVTDLNAIVEARAKEIVENVYARISEVIDVKSLGYGIVLAGCASELNNLPELIQERFKINVRHSTIRSSLLNGDSDMMGNPLYMTAVSLMLKGTEPCVSHPLASQEPVGDGDKEDEDKDVDRREKPRGGFIKRSRRKKPAPAPDADAKDAGADPVDAAGKPEGKNGKKGNSLGRFIGELFSDES